MMKILGWVLFTAIAVVATPPANDETICLNADERELYKLINEYRKSAKLEAIPLSTKLCKVAQAHTHDLMENYNQESANVCNPHSWSDKGQWSSCCYTADHKKAQCMWDKPKEIAGYASPGFEIAYYHSQEVRAAAALTGWKGSPAHNPLLVNDGIWKKVKWKALGISLYKNYGVVWFGELPDSTTPSACEE